MSRTIVPDHAPNRPPEYDEPIYWFAMLERAINFGDLQAAAAAQSELDRLGVAVRYGGLRRKGARHA